MSRSPRASAHRPSTRARALARALAGSMLALAAVLIPGVALADQPLNLPEPVTDLTSAQVLQDGRDEIDAALTSLQDNSDYQLWVVFADTFDDIDPEEWANQTADLSDLGSDDVLLAVATEARRFTLNASDAVAQDDFDRAYDALEPALADAASGEGTWANVVVASAEALEGGSGGFSLLIVVIVIAVIVLVVFLVVRAAQVRWRGREPRAGTHRGTGQPVGFGPGGDRRRTAQFRTGPGVCRSSVRQRRHRASTDHACRGEGDGPTGLRLAQSAR